MSKRSSVWRVTPHEPSIAFEAARLILTHKLAGEVLILDHSKRETWQEVTRKTRVSTWRVKGRVLSKTGAYGAFNVKVSMETRLDHTQGHRWKARPFEARGFLAKRCGDGDQNPQVALLLYFFNETEPNSIFFRLEERKRGPKDVNAFTLEDVLQGPNNEDDLATIDRLKKIASTMTGLL